MNGVDLFLIIIFLLSVYAGYRHGFISGMLNLLVLAGSLVGAFFLYPYLAGWLLQVFPKIDNWRNLIAFFLLIILFRSLLTIIVHRFSKTIPKQNKQSQINKAGGVIPGAVNGFVWATIVSGLLLGLPLSDGITNQTRESKVANLLAPSIEWLNEKFSPIFDGAIGKSINNLTVDPGSDKMVSLPFTVSNAKPRPDLEERMLEIVNKERQKEGLQPLEPDVEMRVVARKHSQDMFNRGYFSHLTPENDAPSDRMRKAGVRFTTSGENLALGATLTICHNGLMKSPGHRANILNPAFGRLGIGVLDGGRHGLMITQNFRN